MEEREFELVNIIGGELGANQRDLARRMNLSLGLTNMLLRRLVTKGYIRIRQLNKKKVEYLLTHQGFSEKMRKSVRYTMKTLGSIGLICRGIMRILKGLYAEGFRRFYVMGSEDLLALIEMTLRDDVFKGVSVSRITDSTQAGSDGILLLCREDSGPMAVKKGVRVLNMVEALAGESSVPA